MKVPRGNKLRAEERRRECIALRRAGATFVEIGQAVGISAMTAYKYVASALVRIRTEMSLDAEEVRTLELERLDRMQLKLAPLVEAGNMAAMDRWLSIMAMRSRLLGLEKAEEDESRQTVNINEITIYEYGNAPEKKG
jgi:hypothetical protein